MTGYQLHVTCPRCGGLLDHLHDRVHDRTEAVAVAQCAACRRTWTLAVQLREVVEPERASESARYRRRLERAV